MFRKIAIRILLLCILLAGGFHLDPSIPAAQAAARPAKLQAEVSAYELIIAMNTLRVSNGLQALMEDPIINAVAQSTAEIMAANQSSWHIGDVSGRIQSAGYGGGAKVWATENFAVGSSYSIDEIMLVWADEAHMIPAVNPAYCHVGAGVAKSSNGMTYFVLQAAYTSGKSCGEYKPPSTTRTPGSNNDGGGGISQIIVPVKIATPDAEGKVFHLVQAGQSFWSIAVTYKITIKDLEVWNNLSKESKLQIGQKLFIPGVNTKGFATPTPVGMILAATPDQDGKIIHQVTSYQTLITISQAYGVNLQTILALNNLQEDWPLQIGQKLLVNAGHITPSPTPRPLTPIEKLTPEGDGKYYHVIKSGETLSWIADLYKVNLNDLMAWNGLNSSSIVYPDQKLLLQVTPPATATFTPGPPTATTTATDPAPTATVTRAAGDTPTPMVTVAAATTTKPAAIPAFMYVIFGLAAIGLAIILVFGRRK